VRFAPLNPTKLVGELTDRLVRRREGPGGTVIGFDGPAECGVTALADAVAEELRGRGAAVIRASTSWWWRPAALRLELGREDVEMLLTGWVDADSLSRELVDPVRSGGGSFISRLRDPMTDRSVRQPPTAVSGPALLLLDGPFLLATELRFDVLVGFQLGRGTLLRSLPPHHQWWTRAFETYDDRYQPLEGADVVLAYDHPSAPAAAGLAGDRTQRSGRR
jgi:hypothetical protein